MTLLLTISFIHLVKKTYLVLSQIIYKVHLVLTSKSKSIGFQLVLSLFLGNCLWVLLNMLFQNNSDECRQRFIMFKNLLLVKAC